MNDPLTDYARMGVAHQMLYPRCTEDPDYHVATLETFIRRTDIETFDCCLPYGRPRQARLCRAIRECGKERLVFSLFFFPFRKFSLAATNHVEQAQVRLLLEDFIEQAVAMGAWALNFASGGPPFAEGTKEHHRCFLDCCRWLCERLARHNIDALIEPFDYDCDKRFLYGPLDRNLELVAQLHSEFPNIGIQLDVAHVVLMHEDVVSSIRRSAPWLKRVHLANCVSRNPADPFYGDRHPPIGYPGGDIDTPQLVDILATLKEIGYLDKRTRGDVVLEINAFPSRSEDESVTDNFQRIQDAWKIAREPISSARLRPNPVPG